MLVIRKEGNDSIKNNDDIINIQSKNEEHGYNLVLYILKNFSDLSVDDQLIIFNKMSFIKTLKPTFLLLRDKVLSDYNQNINQESITITDLKADYHINNGMLEMHLDSIEQINNQLDYYENEFIKEKSKIHPDFDNLTKISLIVERLINRRSVLSVGTPIILYFRYQSKRQKIEVQMIKEKYEQKVLTRITEQQKEKKQTENVENPSKVKTDIQEKDSVTNNIDELEHYAKLKDTRITTFRRNVDRSNNKQDTEQLRVQSVTNDSNKTGSTGQDPISESTRSADQRRTKEAVF